MKLLKLAAIVTLISAGVYVQADEHKKERQMLAQSYLYANSPKMEFEKWLT